MRPDQFVVPAAELGLRKLLGNALPQPLGPAAAIRRIVLDVGVIKRDGRLRHG